MSVSHTITRQWSGASGVAIASAITTTSGQELNISENIPQSSTDLLVACVVDVSQLKSVYIASDYDVTIETNDGTSPGETLAVKGGKPITWVYGDTVACPLTVDVTALYCTTGAIGTAGAALEIRLLIDPTV